MDDDDLDLLLSELREGADLRTEGVRTGPAVWLTALPPLARRHIEARLEAALAQQASATESADRVGNERDAAIARAEAAEARAEVDTKVRHEALEAWVRWQTRAKTAEEKIENAEATLALLVDAHRDTEARALQAEASCAAGRLALQQHEAGELPVHAVRDVLDHGNGAPLLDALRLCAEALEAVGWSDQTSHAPDCLGERALAAIRKVLPVCR